MSGPLGHVSLCSFTLFCAETEMTQLNLGVYLDARLQLLPPRPGIASYRFCGERMVGSSIEKMAYSIALMQPSACSHLEMCQKNFAWQA